MKPTVMQSEEQRSEASHEQNHKSQNQLSCRAQRSISPIEPKLKHLVNKIPPTVGMTLKPKS